MSQLTLSEGSIQQIIEGVSTSKGAIGNVTRAKGWKLTNDFYVEYLKSIVHNILYLIVTRVKDYLKSERKKFANKFIFNKTFPNGLGINKNIQDIVKDIESVFDDDLMHGMIQDKMTYDVECFGINNVVKSYEFSKEFTELIRTMMAVKIFYFTNGLMLVASTTTLNANDILKYSEIAGTIERLTEGITGVNATPVVVKQQSRVASPRRRVRSPKKKNTQQ